MDTDTTALPEGPPHPPTFWALVERRAEESPDRRYLEDEHGRSLTFSELRDRAERVAAGLVDLGIGPGARVSWQLPTSLEAGVLMAALSRLGAVQNPVIPILRAREVGFIARQVGTELLVVPGAARSFDHVAMARDLASELGCQVLVSDRDAAPGAHGLGLPDGDPATLPPPPEPVGPDGAPVRWVFYSSGTSAEPKGARHTDWTVMNGANAELYNKKIQADDCYPIAWPITHIGGTVMMTVGLTVGCRFVFLESFDPSSSPRLMAERGATILGSAVPFFRAYLQAQREHGPEPLFPLLRMCVSGGAPKPPELHVEVKEVLGGAGILSGWGLTEFPIASTSRMTDTDEELMYTEGPLAPWVQVRVVDLQGHEVGPGEEGELRLKGPQLFRGYLDESLDAEAFDDQGWFRTGDLGVIWPRGHVQITGRSKDVIIRNAENLSAPEIEGAVASHPKVADVAVIGLPHPRTGEQACAVVVLADGVDELALSEVAEHCAALGLARQKIPERLEVVDALPRSPMGKVQKRELQQRYGPSR